MEYEMKKLGWFFHETVAGRLVFRNRAGELSVFKSWSRVRDFVNERKTA